MAALCATAPVIRFNAIAEHHCRSLNFMSLLRECLGELPEGPKSKGDRDNLKAAYGKLLLQRYMKVLEDDTVWKSYAPGHDGKDLYVQ